MRRYSIQTKIVLPFLLLFAFVTLGIPLMTAEIFAWKYNEQFIRETQEWFNVIRKTGFIQDAEKVKQAYSVEVMVFGSDYTLNATTFNIPSHDEENWQPLPNKVKLHQAAERLKQANEAPVVQDVTLGGKPYKAFYLLLPLGRFYCLLRPMDDIAAAKRTLTWYMLGIALVVSGLVALISHLIGKNLIEPIKTLVGFTTKVASGNLDEQCEIKTQDEIRDLAVAFNQMTRDLQQSREKLIQAERLATAGKMSASFAHEIRNPLSSMRMLAQMLMQKPEISAEQHQQSLRYILEEIERIDSIVKGLMDFARPATLNLVEQPLAHTLKAVLALMEANLAHHKIQLVLALAPALPNIPFDADKLKQAVMNVVLNAMEAMPEGGTLTIATVAVKGDVYIKITDTGVGIPETDIAHLFEPFFTRKTQGVGLGLANVKRILEEHGGSVKIESTLGEGTTVSMQLPMNTGSPL